MGARGQKFQMKLEGREGKPLEDGLWEMGYTF